MLATMPSYAYVVQAPISLTQSMFNKNMGNVGASPTIDKQIIIDLINRHNLLLIEAQSDTIKLTKEQAGKILIEIEPQLKIIAPLDRVMTSIRGDGDELLISIKSMWSNVKELIDDIKMIAIAEEIDEKSKDYMDFIIKLSEECSQSPRVHGEESLFKLFDA
jgi:hypothetical protein